QQAVQKIIALRNKGYLWVVDADIASFFDEVDHDILLAELSKYVHDPKVIDLIRQWLNVNVSYNGKLIPFTKCVSQGSPRSPLLSNLYLDTFDESIKRGHFSHVRFADDFVILCRNKPEAEEALELTEEVLGKLQLHLNQD